MLHHLPNIMTLSRIAAIVPICWLLWQDAYLPALIGLVIAGLSDGLDGYLARRFGWHTFLGAVLDPLADKLFIVSLMVLFAVKGALPWWLMWLVLGRDVVIVSGALVYRLVIGTLEMKPLLISKMNTALQILLLTFTLLHLGFYPLPPLALEGVQWLVAATSLFSGLAYVCLWTYYAFNNKEVSA